MTSLSSARRFGTLTLVASMLICGCVGPTANDGDNPKRYCIIDLSPNRNAEVSPVSYMARPPTGGFNVDEYKTTKLVLRLIDPGSFMMCGEYRRSIDRPYYCAIFEVTQKQYEIIMGSNPSMYTGDLRPVERISWNMTRGFIARLRSLSGINVDLPTEPQWEYACRAGTMSLYNNGGDTEADLAKVGRYIGNQSDNKGGYASMHTTVGSYEPNAWGLYDMHGNVDEWCLENWYNPSGEAIDRGLARAKLNRSGAWNSSWDRATASFRGYSFPTINGADMGIRVVVNPEE